MANAVEVSELEKAFVVPEPGIETLKARLARRKLRRDAEQMTVLDGINFNVELGELFAIVGRNGSGKSTLLKLMAGVYRADRGSIKVRGRVAPIIELGVGFHPELTARENVVLNGVMMGLNPEEARSRLYRVVHFAGLDDFASLKLKNFSTGMRVRLAFAIMIHSDAEVMLIDEVLAVGDGAFREQSESAIRELNAAGRTIVLVTHAMQTVKQLCDRAMVLEDGRVDLIGSPDAAAERYHELAGHRTSLERGRGTARGAPGGR